MLTTGIHIPVGLKIYGEDEGKIEAIGAKIESLFQPLNGTRSVFAERTRPRATSWTTKNSPTTVSRMEEAQKAVSSAVGGDNVTTTLFLILASLALAQPGKSATHRGAPVTPPLSKPSFVLTDTSGAPFDFWNTTKASVTLLFFGYTYCPDQCPMHMANIGVTLQKLPPICYDRSYTGHSGGPERVARQFR